MTQDTKIYKRLLAYIKPYWKLQGLNFLVMIVLTLLTLALPAAIQYMIDTLIPNLVSTIDSNPDYSQIVFFGLFLLGIYFGEVLFGWIRDYLAAYIGVEIIKDLRLELFAHLQKLSLRFFSRQKIGEIMSRLLSDVSRLQDMLSTNLLMLFTNVFMLIGILAYLISINWMMTLVAVIPVPITIFVTNRFGSKLNRLMYDVQHRMAALSSKIQESLISIKTIKVYNQEEKEIERVDEIITNMNPKIVKASVTSSLGVNLTQFINMIGPIIVLAWGVFLISTGGIKLGELIAFYILLTYLYSPIRGLSETYIQVQSALASANRVFEYLDLIPEIQDASKPIVQLKSEGLISFDNVSFAYEPDRFALSEFSLEIRPKEKIALVGPSGSGKTTIINLLMRFYDPQTGTIELDNIDLRSLSLSSLRKQISLVEQDPMIFNMSLKDNITFGYPEASESEIRQAAMTANIHDFIMTLPEQYDTIVGERGMTLSGGEKQRLCLARAIIMNPSILILDEATSALDANSDKLIQSALEDALKDKTVIFIAHRLSTVQYVDRIITLNNGKIVDQGSHGELMNRCSLYNELANNQMFS